jgi:biopolymer transport protein ExbD
MKFKHRPMSEATFDLTPMIDVVLLLIIFFMLSSHFAKTQLTQMDLPVEPGEPPKAQNAAKAELVIDLDRAGGTSILGEAMTNEHLEEVVGAEVRRTGAAAGDLDLLIRADRLCPAEHLNRLATMLMKLNVRSWKLATAGPEAAGAPAASGGGL